MLCLQRFLEERQKFVQLKPFIEQSQFVLHLTSEIVSAGQELSNK